MTRIRPNFGEGYPKWVRGAITDSGIIYGVPCAENHGILKIDTNTDNVTELDANLVMICGIHVLPFSMDVFTSCRHVQTVS